MAGGSRIQPPGAEIRGPEDGSQSSAILSEMDVGSALASIAAFPYISIPPHPTFFDTEVHYSRLAISHRAILDQQCI